MLANLGRSLLLLLLIFTLAACGEDVAKPTKPRPRAKAKTVKKAPAKKVVKKAAEDVDKYVYDPAGQRDPFVPLLRLQKPVGQSANVPLTPLQKFDLSQFRLVGVLVGKGEPRAMVTSPGGKSYILKRGVKIGKNNGVVIKIGPEAVDVEEKYYDFTGAVRTNVKQIKLPQRQGVK